MRKKQDSWDALATWSLLQPFVSTFHWASDLLQDWTLYKMDKQQSISNCPSNWDRGFLGIDMDAMMRFGVWRDGGDTKQVLIKPLVSTL